LVTGVAAGCAWITATASDGRTTATSAVSVWQNDGGGYLRYLASDPTFYGWSWWHSPPSVFNTPTLTASTATPITVACYKASGAADEAFGIHFFVQDNNDYYKFTISANGQYHFQKCVGGTLTDLVAWTSSSAINKGFGSTQLNTISIWQPAAGQISVSINGSPVVSGLSDSAFSAGRVSFYASNGNPSDSYPESFPGTPEDIRYKVTGPFTYP
jgi:hypothetical protein